MGMDLKPINPSADAPKYPDDCPYEPRRGQARWGRYNWSGWGVLLDSLREWGVDTAEFAGSNDGDVISDETCKKVADAIEKHAPADHWLRDDVIYWRTCGGYEQH